jgi:uncharacterized protein (TIGR03435 family)
MRTLSLLISVGLAIGRHICNIAIHISELVSDPREEDPTMNRISKERVRSLLWAAGVVAFLMGIANCNAARAEAQDEPPSFEVASIRPHVSEVRVVSTSISGSRVTFLAYPLLGLVMDAYQVKRTQVTGGPEWMTEERYDINARMTGEGTPTIPEVRLALQKLLVERFQLKAHRENRQMIVYALTVGKKGPNLKASTADQSSLRFGASGSAPVSEIVASRGSMGQLADQLANAGLDRPVLDETGLTGAYDYTLRWASGLSVPERSDTQAADPNSPPSLFTALQEQLGLKLSSEKRLVETLHIDSVQKPSPD